MVMSLCVVFGADFFLFVGFLGRSECFEDPGVRSRGRGGANFIGVHGPEGAQQLSTGGRLFVYFTNRKNAPFLFSTRPGTRPISFKELFPSISLSIW